MPGRDIFLSYSSQDETIVGLALEKLEAAGHRCWFAPRDIPPGEFYAGQIIQALRESRMALLFFSAHSNASEQVVREINFAVSHRLPMLVVRLDQTALSNHFEYLIRINQWLDVTQLSSDAERIDKIVAQVETSLAKSGPKTSTAKAPVAMVFGDFQILADSSGKPIELGRGGMGVTYRARQVSMGGREVALKVIQPELLGDDNIRRRFLREAQLAGEIDHENIALVHLRGQEGDSYFYAMQLVEGVDLDRYVKARGPLNVRDALSVIAQVASALTAANSKGLIHRDIKPSNIMAVRRRNTLRIKLIDFGLAKQVTQQDIHNSLSGKDEFKGTLAYASPEQCQAFPLDTRSDLYSLGVTLWFLLSGKVPFTGNLAAVSGAHVWAPLPLQQLPPLPEAVLELLKSLLAKNPADRPQTPGELEDRAEALLRSLPSDSVSDSAAIQAEPAASSEGSVGPEADSTLIGAPVLVSYLEPAAGQIREDRFELRESLPEGVSGRLFRARERRGSESRIVAVKFLHPSICAQEEAAESLKTQFAALQKLTLQHLLRYFALELGSQPPFLVREWVQGIPLTGVLRLKAGTLTPLEVSALLEPLPRLLDDLASSGLSLITVRLSKLWARLPPELELAKFESWVKQATAEDWDSRLALDPLSLRSLVSRSVQPDSDVTLLPTSRSLALQQNRAGIQGRTPTQLLASVVYELLAGQPPQADSFRPLAAIPDNANQRLKHALAREGPYQLSASELWLALKADFPQAPKASTPTPRQSDLDPSTGSTPPTPTEPPSKPRPPPTPDTSGRQKTNWARLWLILGSFAVFISIILLASWLASHSSPPQPSPSPTREPTVSPTPTATPTPTSSNDARASVAFDRGNAAVGKGDDQEAIAQYSEAIRLKPDYAFAFNNRGNVYSNLKQYDKAIADYSDYIRLRPNDPDGYNNRAHCYEELGNNQDAQRDRAKAKELSDKGNPTPTASPNITNDARASVAFDRGNVVVGKGDDQEAIAQFSEAIRLKPDYAFAFNNRGNVYSNLKQYDKAIADYSDYIRLRPNDPDGYNNRAHCYEELGNTQDAQRDRAKAKELSDKGNPTPTASPNTEARDHLNRGNDAFNNRNYQGAISEYTQAIELDPDFAEAYLKRADTYATLGFGSNAEQDRKTAKQLGLSTPASPFSAAAKGHLNRGNDAFNNRNYQEAIGEYTQAIELDPDFAEAYLKRVDTYATLGFGSNAEQDRKKAEELHARQ
jgi:serine/threonine protein kinase/Flp pilus assembly protein TadD